MSLLVKIEAVTAIFQTIDMHLDFDDGTILCIKSFHDSGHVIPFPTVYLVTCNLIQLFSRHINLIQPFWRHSCLNEV